MKKFYSLLVLFFFVATWKTTAQPCEVSETPGWETMEPMPTPRYGLSVSVVDGIIYAIGGASSFGTSLATVEAYDPVTNEWLSKTPMPTARVFLCTEVIDGQIYAIGGINGEEQGFDTMYTTIEVYDPVLDDWSTKQDMPFSRALFSTSEVDGIIYLMGGANLNALPNLPPIYSDVWAYDPVTEEWDHKANMSYKRALLTSCVVNETIFAIGGSPVWGTTGLPKVESFLPSENNWKPEPDLPENRLLLPSTAVCERIFLMGGADNFIYGTRDNFQFDPEFVQFGWTTGVDMPTARHSLSTAAVGGKIYAIGGRVAKGSPGLNMIEEFDTGIIVASNSLEVDEHSKELTLNQNYPNPFHSNTTIEFHLPKSDFVTLRIYDQIGQEVTTLVSGQYASGAHQYNWYAKGLESGIYFYKLEGGGQFQVRKAVVLK